MLLEILEIMQIVFKIFLCSNYFWWLVHKKVDSGNWMFGIKKQEVQFDENGFESNQGDQIVMNNKKSHVKHIQ